MKVFISHNAKDQFEFDNLGGKFIKSNAVLGEYKDAISNSGLFSLDPSNPVFLSDYIAPSHCNILARHIQGLTSINEHNSSVELGGMRFEESRYLKYIKRCSVNDCPGDCIIAGAGPSGLYNAYRLKSINDCTPNNCFVLGAGASANYLNNYPTSANGCVPINSGSCIIAGISPAHYCDLYTSFGFYEANISASYTRFPIPRSYALKYPLPYLDHFGQEKLHTEVSTFYREIKKSRFRELQDLAEEIKMQLDKPSVFGLFHAVELLKKFEKDHKNKQRSFLCFIKYLRFRLFGRSCRDLRRGYRNIVHFFFKNMDDNSGADADNLFLAYASKKQLLVNQQMNYNDLQRNHRMHRAIAA